MAWDRIASTPETHHTMLQLQLKSRGNVNVLMSCDTEVVPILEGLCGFQYESYTRLPVTPIGIYETVCLFQAEPSTGLKKAFC